jgi:exonuclease I
MASFIELYGGNKETMAHSGLASVKRAEAAGLSIGQIQQMARDQGISFGYRAQDYFRQKQQDEFTNQIASMQTSLRQQLNQQQAEFAAAQRRQQERMEQLQRQVAPQQVPQVLGIGKSLTIRPGARTRFSRPELQIKSVNI